MKIPNVILRGVSLFTRKRIVIATSLIATCLLGAFVYHSRHADVAIISQSEDESPELGGYAFFDDEGKMSMTIVNNSASGRDCFIAAGRLEVTGRYENDSKNVLVIKVWPTIARTQLFCISASDRKEKLVDSRQLIQLEIQIPKEYKDYQYDAVDIDLEACLMPIRGKGIVLDGQIVRLKCKKQK